MKKYLKKILFSKGYKINKINNTPLLNDNPFLAAKEKIKSEEPIFFDIGINHGQTLKKIKKEFPKSIIHGFEPSKYCFKQLENDFKSDKIILNNLAVGEKEDVLKFNEYSWDALNSLLERAFTKAKIIEKYDVNVTTIDNYCKKNGINKIDFLKTDTEGFELKVLKGAKELMSNNKIQFIHVEMFFELNFIGQSSAGDIFNFLEENNFSLIRFYDFSNTKNGIASKSDALFINSNYER